MYVSQIMDCFRDFDQKIILVKGIDQRTLMIIKLAGFHVRPDDNAMLVFCYIDREAGISYELLCAAYIFDDGEVAFEPGNDDTSYKFRYGTFQGEIADIKGYKPFGQFAGKVQMIVDHYSAPEDILEVRRIQQLDLSRAQGFPDDIVVYFIKDGLEPEKVWCRTVGSDRSRNLIQMKLLNEPKSPYGMHEGDIIDVTLFPMDNGELKATPAAFFPLSHE